MTEGNEEVRRKFMLSAVHPDGRASRTPWTGMDLVLKRVRDLLNEGFIVQVSPYTQEEWAKKGH